MEICNYISIPPLYKTVSVYFIANKYKMVKYVRYVGLYVSKLIRGIEKRYYGKNKGNIY